ncbi:hypothetical protein D0860_05525, partial [Hortaea werneckii]
AIRRPGIHATGTDGKPRLTYRCSIPAAGSCEILAFIAPGTEAPPFVPYITDNVGTLDVQGTRENPRGIVGTLNMGKVPKATKKREVSVHSRAARRGEEPPSKDLAVKSASVQSDYKPWLHNAQNAAVGKKKKSKQLSRQQKQRQQKALEKADVNVDKLQSRIADSKARGKRVQARRKDWEELNENLGDGQKKRVGAAGEEEQVSRPRVDMEDVELQGDTELPANMKVAENEAPRQGVEGAAEMAEEEEVDEVL